MDLSNLATNLNILYAEDDKTNQLILQSIISDHFKNITFADDGQEALELYEKNSYDIILLDIMMPRKNGIEVAEYIKEKNPEQKILIITSHGESSFLVDAINIGVDGYILKPFSHVSLIKAFLNVIRQLQLESENKEYKVHLEDLVYQRTIALEKANKELQENLIKIREGEQIKQNMKIAQKVQQHLLPNELTTRNSLVIDAKLVPAEYVGGDYYDYFEKDKNTSYVVIADVSGHGVGSAITMSSFRAYCNSILLSEDNLEESVYKINKFVLKDTLLSELFITVFILKYIEDQSYIEYISAGHNPILHYKTKTKELQRLNSLSMPMGIFDAPFPSKKIEINKGDSFVLYTDGLVEAVNSYDEEYTLEKLESLCKEHGKKSAKELNQIIWSSLYAHINDGVQSDDVTIVTVTIKE